MGKVNRIARYHRMAEGVGLHLKDVPQWDGEGAYPKLPAQFLAHVEAKERVLKCQGTGLPSKEAVLVRIYQGNVALIGRGVGNKYFDIRIPQRSPDNIIHIGPEADMSVEALEAWITYEAPKESPFTPELRVKLEPSFVKLLSDALQVAYTLDEDEEMIQRIAKLRHLLDKEQIEYTPDDVAMVKEVIEALSEPRDEPTLEDQVSILDKLALGESD